MTDLPAESAQTTPIGRVALVGAGPGDPDLITAGGLDRLRRAEVVVYDALSSPALLDEAPPTAERIDVGKRARAHKLTQDRINELLVAKAREGYFVVRLKGGDPYLFGRGAEEAAHLARHGIAFEVIPGITAGIAAPMTAGIPVTHRQLASTVTFVTGHEDPTKDASAIDYAALARLIAVGGTVCFYMGVGRLRAIVGALTGHGLAAQTPAAVIQWGTTPRQRAAHGTLEALPELIERERIGAPAIIVVGKVAALPDEEPGLDFFTRRPLFGQTVLVTRTRRQASVLRQQLEALGAEVIEAPAIEIEFLPVPQTLEAAALTDYQWLILTSTNAVDWLADWLEGRGDDARALSGVKVAVVGRATAEALRRRFGIRADFVPDQSNGEALASEMIERFALGGSRCLLLRGDLAGAKLPAMLRAAGAVVEDQTVYRTRPLAELPDAALTALREGRVDWVTFTSSSTVHNLVRLLGDERDWLRQPRVASIGPTTSEAVREAGLTVAVEARRAEIEGLAEAMVAARCHDE